MRNFFLIAIIFAITACNFGRADYREPNYVRKIELKLSAFGVESDNFPSIDATVDLLADTSFCRKSYYNPAFKDSVYALNKNEMQTIVDAFTSTAVAKLKKEYTVAKTDQPTSTITIYQNNVKVVIKDYGLIGDQPLQQLYKIVYKL